eukprot:1178273-Prorocentrum_minimum.AAC.3
MFQRSIRPGEGPVEQVHHATSRASCSPRLRCTLLALDPFGCKTSLARHTSPTCHWFRHAPPYACGVSQLDNLLSYLIMNKGLLVHYCFVQSTRSQRMKCLLSFLPISDTTGWRS